MRTAVVFRVEDMNGNVILTEVRNYVNARFSGHVRRRVTKHLQRFRMGYTVRTEFLNECLTPVGVWLDTSSQEDYA